MRPSVTVGQNAYPETKLLTSSAAVCAFHQQPYTFQGCRSTLDYTVTKPKYSYAKIVEMEGNRKALRNLKILKEAMVCELLAVYIVLTETTTCFGRIINDDSFELQV